MADEQFEYPRDSGDLRLCFTLLTSPTYVQGTLREVMFLSKEYTAPRVEVCFDCIDGLVLSRTDQRAKHEKSKGFNSKKQR